MHGTDQDRTSQRFCKGFNYNTSEPTCSNCKIRYTGASCEIDIFYDDLPFMTCLLILQVGLISFHFLLVLWASLGIYIKICLARSARCLDAFMLVMYCCMFTCVGRCLAMLDPIGFYEILGARVEFLVLGIVNAVRSCGVLLSVSIVYDVIHTSIAEEHSFKRVKQVSFVLGICQLVLVSFVLVFTFVLDEYGIGAWIINMIVIVEAWMLAACCWIVVPQLKRIKQYVSRVARYVRYYEYLGIFLTVLAFSISAAVFFTLFWSTKMVFFHWGLLLGYVGMYLSEYVCLVVIIRMCVFNPRKVLRVLNNEVSPFSSKKSTKSTDKEPRKNDDC